MPVVIFIIGLISGATFGFIIAGLLFANGGGDE